MPRRSELKSIFELDQAEADCTICYGASREGSFIDSEDCSGKAAVVAVAAPALRASVIHFTLSRG